MKTLVEYKYWRRIDSQCQLVFCLTLIMACIGCKKFVQVPLPNTKLATSTVFSDNATATSAVTNIYALMWNNLESFRMTQFMGLYSDEFKNYGTSSDQVQLYNNSLQAVKGLEQGPWINAYNYIYAANAVISGLQSNNGCSAAVKQQLTGEAYFVRAFWHFYLTNIYGDVPIALSTDYNVNATLKRSPRMQVLGQVISDLDKSKQLLNNNYVDATDTTTTIDRIRPNKAVATAFLARACLYYGDYSKSAVYYIKADSAASAVIDNNLYSLTSLDGVFLENSTEAIWQLQMTSQAPWDTWDGFSFILTGAPSSGFFNSAAISTQLLSAFEANDQRATAWIGSYSTTDVPAVTYYFPYKYKINYLANQEYTMVFRLAEQYLIRAEARMHEGDLTRAASDLNVIRKRAGLPNTTATTADDLAKAILHERRVELFTEWGHRWFDLQRTGNAAAVMSVVTPQKGGTWNNNNYQLLFPIPEPEIALDHNLTQNPGY